MVTSMQLTGTNDEIAGQIQHLNGRILSAILLVEDTAGIPEPVSNEEFLKILNDMQGDLVHVPHADDSREAIYTRMPGE